MRPVSGAVLASGASIMAPDPTGAISGAPSLVCVVGAFELEVLELFIDSVLNGYVF
jgi:hypothetical protein